MSAMLMACGGGGDDGGEMPPGTGGTTAPDPVLPGVANVEKTNAMNVYAHYMPWFVEPGSSGVWNHWTMSADALKADMSNLASHYRPLTGAYASDDATVLDYQCMLMKYSGIDGVMIDWYGTQQKNDYPANLKHAEAMVKAIEKAGLKFAVVYEDQTLEGTSDKVAQARLDMQYLATTMFKSKSYVKVDGRPLLMVFGPQAINTPAEWTRVFSILGTKPEFIVLNGGTSKVNDETNKNSDGEYLWVNPNPDYSVAKNYGMYIGGAMPGFWDVYKEFGQGNGYTTYDHENGALFNRQLKAAKDAGLDWLQISTWNDYGEGTVIEPTVETEYRYLTSLQTFTGVTYRQSHLQLIYKWYGLSKKYAGDKAKSKTLEQCYTYLNGLMPDKAEQLMQGL